MVTKQQALTASSFHWGNCARETGPRGGVKETIVAYRRNGATKTWATRPDDFRLPVKHGLRDYADITPALAHMWHAAEDCPLNATTGDSAMTEHTAFVQTVTVPTLPGSTFYRVVCACGMVTRETTDEARAKRAMVAHQDGFTDDTVHSIIARAPMPTSF